MIILYGIANCDTVKKARLWLKDNNLEYEFHDYKKSGVISEQVINRAGVTWRKLTDQRKAEIHDPTTALTLMQEKPSVIKRPILVLDDVLLLGFSEASWRETLLTS